MILGRDRLAQMVERSFFNFLISTFGGNRFPLDLCQDFFRGYLFAKMSDLKYLINAAVTQPTSGKNEEKLLSSHVSSE